ncbi:unnamed protein product [Phytomonas sp. Hart1]|nr:unnamed protein product [Phytomonas sp. Hart1]|eukprot:CCW65972.1 unnamed protein product [Phytomonas sp. isolate Hart1]
MGNSASAANVSDAFHSSLSNNPFDAENVDTIFSLSFSKKNLMSESTIKYVRALRHFHTDRFALLLYHCIKELSVMREKKKASVLSFKAEDIRRFLTALQILRLLLPIAFEDGETDIDENAQEQRSTATSIILPKEKVPEESQQPLEFNSFDAGSFSQNKNVAKKQSTYKFQQLFFMERSKCNDSEVDSHFPLLPLQEAREAPLMLGPYLAWVLVESCFIRGLTLHEENSPTKLPLFSLLHPEVDMTLLWYPGIVCANFSDAPLASSSSEVHTPRKEILKTLLVMVSSPLFYSSGYRDIIFIESLISVSVIPLMPTLAVSLLNAILIYKPHTHIPYVTKLSIDEKKVVIMGSRFLSAILYYTGIPMDAFPNAVRDKGSTKKGKGPNNQGLTNVKDSEEGNQVHSSTTNFQQDAQAVYKILEDSTAISFTNKQDDNSEMKVSGGLAMHSFTSSKDSREMALHQPSDKILPIPKSDSFLDNSQSRPSHKHTVGGASKNIVHLCFVHSIRKLVHELTMSEAKLVLDRLKSTMVPTPHLRHKVLPSSWLSVIPESGLVFLLSKLLDISPSVSNQFSLNPEVLPYVVRIVECGLDSQKKANNARQTQVYINILLRLSQNRGFTLLCNQPLSTSLTFPFPKLPSEATFNDFLVTALSLFIGFGDASLGSHLVTCSFVLSNMSSFIIGLGPVASRSLVSVFAYLAHRCLEYTASSSFEMLRIYGPTMAAICEAISCLFRYHKDGSHYVITFLLNHRGLIRRVREIYISSESLRASINVPFMIQDLETVLAAALPIVDSLGFPSTRNANSEAEQNCSEFSHFWCHPEMTFEIDKTVMRKLKTLVLVGILLPHEIIIKGVQTTKQIEEQLFVLFWESMYLSFDPGTFGYHKSIKLLHFT